MELITAERLAERLQVTPDSIRRMTAAGLLPHYRLGPRQASYNFEAVLAALEVHPT